MAKRVIVDVDEKYAGVLVLTAVKRDEVRLNCAETKSIRLDEHNYCAFNELGHAVAMRVDADGKEFKTPSAKELLERFEEYEFALTRRRVNRVGAALFGAFIIAAIAAGCIRFFWQAGALGAICAVAGYALKDCINNARGEE